MMEIVDVSSCKKLMPIVVYESIHIHTFVLLIFFGFSFHENIFKIAFCLESIQII